MRVDDKTDGPSDVLASTDLPAIGDAYETSSDAKLVDIVANPLDDNPYVWEVIGSYSQKTTDPETSPSTSPLDRRVRWSYGSVQRSEALLVDQNGDDVVNSAGDRFDPPIEVARPQLRMTARRNELGFDPATIVAYVGRVNSAAWRGFDTEMVLCTGITADERTENGTTYFEVSYEFEVHWDDTLGWNTLEVLDQGFNRLTTPTTKEPIYMEPDRVERPSNPMPLDGSGDELPIGDPFVYIPFAPYPQADFGALALG